MEKICAGIDLGTTRYSIKRLPASPGDGRRTKNPTGRPKTSDSPIGDAATNSATVRVADSESRPDAKQPRQLSGGPSRNSATNEPSSSR